jgi:hypothetical protein
MSSSSSSVRVKSEPSSAPAEVPLTPPKVSALPRIPKKVKTEPRQDAEAAAQAQQVNHNVRHQ